MYLSLEKEKAIKDRDAAVTIIKALMANGEEVSLRKTFDKLSLNWQKMVLKGLALSAEPQLIKILNKG